MRILTGALILFALAACGPSRDDPVSSAKAFVKLARGAKCKETWRFYTRASQQVLEARSKKETKASPAYAEMFAPGNRECTGRFAHYLPRTVREVSRRGDTAMLAAIMRTGTLFAIIPFMSSPRQDSPAELTMVLEDGVWKVSIPPPPENPIRRTTHPRFLPGSTPFDIAACCIPTLHSDSDSDIMSRHATGPSRR